MNNCLNCGKPIFPGSGYKKGLAKFDSSEALFCCETCYDEYQEKQAIKRNAKIQAKAAKKEAKVAKKEAKATKKEADREAKFEKAKTTSDESLAKVTKLCLVAGYVGAHRFVVGKTKSAILMILWIVFVLFYTFTNGFTPGALLLLLLNVAIWLYDFALIKAKKFTDSHGYTIRE